MSKNKNAGRKSGSNADIFTAELVKRMDKCPDVEALNNSILIPFAQALEEVCQARGYLLNIYGERSNIAFTNEEDADIIYQMIEAYLDGKEDDQQSE